MTPRAARAAATAAIFAAALAACRSPRTPQAPPRSGAADVVAAVGRDLPTLQECLDAYPLGDLPTRIDLLASSPEHSMHLIQTRRPIARHYRAKRTEIMLVLAGSGICYTGDRSRPITADTAFRFEPGVVHTVIPDDGRTIVALSYLSPPLAEGADDRVTVR